MLVKGGPAYSFCSAPLVYVRGLIYTQGTELMMSLCVHDDVMIWELFPFDLYEANPLVVNGFPPHRRVRNADI